MGPAGTRRAHQAMFAPACKRNEIFFIVLMDGKHEALRRYLHLLAKGGKFSIDGKHEALRRCLHLFAKKRNFFFIDDMMTFDAFDG